MCECPIVNITFIKKMKKNVEQRTDFKLFLEERFIILDVQPGDSSDIADGLSGHVHHRSD